MDTLELAAALLALTALLTYCNLRFLRLPHPIGVMVLALGISLGLILLDHFSVPAGHAMRAAVAQIDFQQTVLRWMLSEMLTWREPRAAMRLRFLSRSAQTVLSTATWTLSLRR